MSCRKIPPTKRTPTALAGGARRQGVLSFGYFSLHKQRKVTRSVAKRERKLLTLRLIVFDLAFNCFLKATENAISLPSLSPWESGSRNSHD